MPPGERRENPYHPDLPASELFVGREIERKRLGEALRDGAPGVIAVMAGRGMGKTSLAQRAQSDAGGGVRVASVPLPRSGEDVLAELRFVLGGKIVPEMLSRSIAARFRVDRRPVTLIIDEIEGLLESKDGVEFLEKLRVVREQPEVGSLLRVVVLGGSRLRDLLQRSVSPFLRSAHWLPVRAFDVEECGRLAREPLGATVSEAVVERLWRETGGHPLLMQQVLRCAVDRGWPRADELDQAIGDVARAQGTLFEMFWRNLRESGQRAYLDMLDRGPLSAGQRLARIGNNPDATLEVLETTGVAWIAPNGDARPHGAMFERWVRGNIATLREAPSDVVKRRRQMRDALWRLIDDTRAIKMIVSDAGLDPSRIDLNGAHALVWFDVLEEAKKQRCTREVLAAARELYPNDPELEALYATLVED